MLNRARSKPNMYFAFFGVIEPYFLKEILNPMSSIVQHAPHFSGQDAERLAGLLRPIRAKINLIPFNTYQGCEFERPDESVINDFKEILTQKHYTVIIRHSKGQDISAACGQLSGQYET